jgi:hypothetical protein
MRRMLVSGGDLRFERGTTRFPVSWLIYLSTNVRASEHNNFMWAGVVFAGRRFLKYKCFQRPRISCLDV